MTLLDNQQKQLLFDYCFGITSEKETARAERLIATNEQANRIYSKLKSALSPLEKFEVENCPDELTECTILRLNNTARSTKLEKLLASEQVKTARYKNRFFWNLGEVLAAAAVIVFVSGIIFAPLKYARQNYWKQRCQSQLARIGLGITNYKADHDGLMPAVATTSGSPWWKVGYQGKENHSNTRHMWLLAKEGYVNTADFVCPGKRQGRSIQFDPSQAKDYNDFPARRYVTYSFRIMPDVLQKNAPCNPKILISDLNPLFEKLPTNYSRKLILTLNKTLRNLNSSNHNRRGQNILFRDGSIRFSKTRFCDISKDDIFTLQNTSTYKGVEVPKCEVDTFLAP